MVKNLIVKFNMKSGKVHEIDIPNPDGKTLEDLVNELNGSGSAFIGVNDGALSIRWSEVESLEDVSHLDLNKAENENELKGINIEVKSINTNEELERIGKYIARELKLSQ